jgi:hypothetical protein
MASRRTCGLYASIMFQGSGQQSRFDSEERGLLPWPVRADLARKRGLEWAQAIALGAGLPRAVADDIWIRQISTAGRD